MAASHVRENALLVHRFKTRKLSRLLIRFVRCFIVTRYSSCAFFLLERTTFTHFSFFSDALFYTHGGTVRLSQVRFVISDVLKQLLRLKV